MKKVLNLVSVFAVAGMMMFSNVASAQEGRTKEERKEISKEKREKVEALRKQHINEKLELSEKEKTAFWAAHDGFKKEMKESRKEIKTMRKNLADNLETLSDADVEKKVKEIEALEMKNAEKKRAYSTKIANIIGYKKLVKLAMAEREFKREMLRKMKEKRGERGGRPGGPRPQ